MMKMIYLSYNFHDDPISNVMSSCQQTDRQTDNTWQNITSLTPMKTLTEVYRN